MKNPVYIEKIKEIFFYFILRTSFHNLATHSHINNTNPTQNIVNNIPPIAEPPIIPPSIIVALPQSPVCAATAVAARIPARIVDFIISPLLMYMLMSFIIFVKIFI